MVPLYSDRISRVPPYSSLNRISTHTGLSPSMVCLSIQFWFLTIKHWASPRSLATTNGVSVDFLSCSYLDVSVRYVRLLYSYKYKIPQQGCVPAFGDLRIKACSQLPKDYRRVPRPSSPLCAKASTKCPNFLFLFLRLNSPHFSEYY